MVEVLAVLVCFLADWRVQKQQNIYRHKQSNHHVLTALEHSKNVFVGFITKEEYILGVRCLNKHSED